MFIHKIIKFMIKIIKDKLIKLQKEYKKTKILLVNQQINQ